MVEHAERTDDDVSKDLFVISSKRWLDHTLMLNQGVIREDWTTTPTREPIYLPGGQRIHANAQKRKERNERQHAEEKKRLERSLEAKWKRFWMSIFGGVALIAPMLLMVLHNDRTTALATTSGSVLLFAIIVAVFTEAPPDITIGAVSAYAAVLVVFVGSALPPVS